MSSCRIARRVAIIIDPKGVLRVIYVEDYHIRRSYAEKARLFRINSLDLQYR
jgi:alkyl hydroperoxide reductase subunit AhpC